MISNNTDPFILMGLDQLVRDYFHITLKRSKDSAAMAGRGHSAVELPPDDLSTAVTVTPSMNSDKSPLECKSYDYVDAVSSNSPSPSMFLPTVFYGSDHGTMEMADLEEEEQVENMLEIQDDEPLDPPSVGASNITTSAAEPLDFDAALPDTFVTEIYHILGQATDVDDGSLPREQISQAWASHPPFTHNSSSLTA